MKKNGVKIAGAMLSLLIAFSSASVQAQSCAQSPSCESLGYNLTSTSECIGTALKCPFDNRYNCVTANDVINKMGPDYTRRKRLNRGIGSHARDPITIGRDENTSSCGWVYVSGGTNADTGEPVSRLTLNGTDYEYGDHYTPLFFVKGGDVVQGSTVQKIYFDGQIIDKDDEINARQGQLIIDGALCNDSVQKEGQEIGDPTEIALVNFSEKHDLPVEKMREKYQRLGEIPFDSDRKLMSTVHKIGDNYKMLTKGAVDVLSGRIDEVKTMDGKRPFTAEDLAELKKVNTEFSQMGLRVLAVCERDVDTVDISVDDEKDYILLGLVAMQDPPREESAEAVRKCKTAGIRPIMITGDHLVTASAIARKIGILDDNGRAVEGREIENLSDEELDEFVSDVSVYARVSPEHKIRIVSAWQRKGYIVSMTGDGVNDAPALKQADIGVAMGITGSEVAKDAASMVLTDDNFATIVKAIENGRNLYRNIQRAIQFLLSGNTAGILAVLYASFMALPVPFKAVHLLFINLLTDSLPAIALGVEPHSSDVMNEKPRPKNQSILTKKVLTNICVEGIVIGVMTMIAFYVGFLRNAEVASTMAFSTLCLSRLVHGFNCKSDKPVWFTKKMWNNKSMIGAFFVGFVLLNAVLLVPALQGIFAVAPLTIAELLTVYGLSLGTFVVVQILKMIRK